MELFRDSNIDFMKYRKFFAVFSVILALLGLFQIFVGRNLNLGVDFAGGTQVTVKFRDQPDVEELRSLMSSAGVEDAQIQRFGELGSNEVIIKTPALEGEEEQGRSMVVEALASKFDTGATGFDLNNSGTDALAELLFDSDPDSRRLDGEEAARAHYEGVAQAVTDMRKSDGLITDWSEVSSTAGVAPTIVDFLKQNVKLGSFSILGTESVGPQIGAELRKAGVLAIVMSLLGMLAYIWYRFELRFGIGALVALVHDVLVTLGLFALARFEFNLTTIAGFLTLVGYSVNDSVVVFDRVRENMRAKRSLPLVDIMNLSLNQTLARTVLTSSTTLLAVGSLFFLGGDVLKGFAFILMIGVLVGTYSSIYVASPFALLWERYVSKRAAKA